MICNAFLRVYYVFPEMSYNKLEKAAAVKTVRPRLIYSKSAHIISTNTNIPITSNTTTPNKPTFQSPSTSFHTSTNTQSHTLTSTPTHKSTSTQTHTSISTQTHTHTSTSTQTYPLTYIPPLTRQPPTYTSNGTPAIMPPLRRPNLERQRRCVAPRTAPYSSGDVPVIPGPIITVDSDSDSDDDSETWNFFFNYNWSL